MISSSFTIVKEVGSFNMAISVILVSIFRQWNIIQQLKRITIGTYYIEDDSLKPIQWKKSDSWSYNVWL